MNIIKKMLSLMIFIFLQTNLTAQVVVDLIDKSKSTEPIDISKSTITIKNLLPGKEYSFEVEMQEDKIPLFNVASLSSGSQCTEDDTNKSFKDAYNSLSNSNNEMDVQKLSKTLKDEIEKLRKADLNKYGFCIFQGTELLNKTILEKNLLFTLRNNQTITVRVKRQTKIDSRDTTLVWVKIFKTPQKSPWLIHYAFTYQPNIISKYDQYFSKADTASANRYTITKKNGNQTKFWENLSPTIMFSYPFTNKNGDSHLAFSAIAATNFSTFSAGAGFSGIVGENFAIGTGIMFTQKNVLNGQYKDGDIIKTNLTFDQLHEKKWGPEIYFTIGLRFDKNPFTGNDNKTKTTDASSTASSGSSPSNVSSSNQ
jgi:hypothetical protein